MFLNQNFRSRETWV